MFMGKQCEYKGSEALKRFLWYDGALSKPLISISAPKSRLTTRSLLSSTPVLDLPGSLGQTPFSSRSRCQLLTYHTISRALTVFGIQISVYGGELKTEIDIGMTEMVQVEAE